MWGCGRGVPIPSVTSLSLLALLAVLLSIVLLWASLRVSLLVVY